MPSTKGYRSYHGKGGAGRIVLIVLLCLILLAAVGFLVLQRYAVYGSDGSIRFDLPWKQTEEPSDPSAPDGASWTPDAPDDSPDVIIDEPEPPAKPELTELHGAELSESVLRGNADAVIVSSFAITPAEIRRLNTTRIPLIGINTASQGFTASVGIDDKAGIRLIVRHLTTLGHRNLLYLYETFDATMGFSSHNRVTGFLEACSELDGVTGQTMDMQAGDDPVDAALTALLARDDAPTALCFHQDSLAIPLFFRLRQCGMAIPTDLSVTGFDNSTFSGEVGLTTVRQKPYDMAVAAARKALDLIEGRTLDQPHEIFPVQLLVRDSTAAPRVRG